MFRDFVRKIAPLRAENGPLAKVLIWQYQVTLQHQPIGTAAAAASDL